MLEFVIDKLISIMGPIATMAREKRELKDTALRAVSEALVETKLYYRDRRAGKPRNLAAEANLAKQWAQAAIPLRYLDVDLALVCEQKSDFWTAPDAWTEDEVKRVGIKLDDVTAAYRQLAIPARLRSKKK